MSRYRDGRTWSGTTSRAANGASGGCHLLADDKRSRVGLGPARRRARPRSDRRPLRAVPRASRAFTRDDLDLTIIDRLDQARYDMMQIAVAQRGEVSRSPLRRRRASRDAPRDAHRDARPRPTPAYRSGRRLRRANAPLPGGDEEVDHALTARHRRRRARMAPSPWRARSSP